MLLTRLKIEQLPGITRPFELAPKPGLNIIVGPNGSGKSSLTRAVQNLLWPSALPVSPFSVMAQFRASDQTWTVVAQTSDSLQWQLAGQAAEAPDLPGAEVATSYKLGVMDLILPDHGQDDLQLARHLRNLMDGGFDLAETEKRLFPLAPKAGRNEAKKLTASRQQVLKISHRYRDLAQREQRLEQLTTRLQTASDADARARVLETLQAARELEARISDLNDELEGFAPGQASVLPDDPQRLEKLKNRERDLDAELSSHAGDLLRLEKDRAHLILAGDLPDNLTPEGIQSLLEKQIARYRNLDEGGHDLVRQIQGLAYAGGGDDSGPISSRQPVDRQTYNRVLELHANLAATEADISSLDRQLAELLARGSGNNWPGVLLLAVGLVLSVLTFILGDPSVSPTSEPGPVLPLWGWPSLAAGFLAAAGGTFLLGRTSGRASGPRRPELENQLSSKKDLLARHREDLQLLARQHDLDLDNPSLVHDLKTLGLRLDDQQQKKQLQGQLVQLNQDKEQALNQARATLQAVGLTGGDSPEQLDTAKEELARQIKALNILEAGIINLETKKSSAEKQLAQIREQLGEFFQRLHLDPGKDNVAAVAHLAASRPAWDKASKELSGTEKQLQALVSLQKQSAHLVDLDEARRLTASQLALRLADEQKLAEDKDDLLKEIAALENEISLAREADDLEKSKANEDQALLALAACREKARESALGRLLLGRVRNQSESRSRPAVLNRAMDLFAEFSGNRYGLVVAESEDGQGLFRAQDHHSGLLLDLNQLSDGTRTQLLLAVRLGFIFTTERGFKPPLFLDDSLATSDPERFAAVVASLARLARAENRQVFFLTADPTAVQAWNRALDRAQLEPAHIMDLARIRQLTAASSLVELQPLPVEPIPQPGQMTPEQYGQALGVPRLEPWAHPDAVHLFFLLPDQLDLLRHLLENGYPTLGTYRAGRSSSSVIPGLTAEYAELMDRRAVLWPLILEKWRIGRNRPLTADDLTNSGAVSQNMSARVLQVLQESRGDGGALMEALEKGAVSGFRQNKKKQLQEYLELNGFLDPRDPLEGEELVRQSLEAAWGSLPHPSQPGSPDSSGRQFILRLAAYLENSL